ncbi:MAG: MCE family protein [Bacteroidetes bacterium]|nr:MCE family protein [Bacteroidota bacterium]
MKMNRIKSIKLGLFVSIGILILILGIYTIGLRQSIFGTSLMVRGIFTDVKGLQVGSNVRFAGIDIGAVSNITIINDTSILVNFMLDKDVQKFIRKDSKAVITVTGLLGNKVVNIMPGSLNSEIIEEGDILPTDQGIEISDILRELEKSSRNTSAITRNIIDITEKINRGEGMFGQVFTDTIFSQNLGRISVNTAELTDNFATITDQIINERGLIGHLLSDTSLVKEFHQVSDNLTIASENLVNIVEKIKQGEGIFGKAFTDTSFLQNIIFSSANTKDATKTLAEITNQIKEGKGFINKLLMDSTFSDSISTTLENLNRGIIELQEASDAVERSWLIRLFSGSKKKERKMRKQ